MKKETSTHVAGVDFLYEVACRKGRPSNWNFKDGALLHTDTAHQVLLCGFKGDNMKTQSPMTTIQVEAILRLFDTNERFALFVHNSQFGFGPVFCVALETSTPEEYSLLQEFRFDVSGKFRSFENALDKEKFCEILYSEKNLQRLREYCLPIQRITYYEY